MAFLKTPKTMKPICLGLLNTPVTQSILTLEPNSRCPGS